MHHCGRRRMLLPVPFLVGDGLAAASAVLPAPPLTEGQVALMKRDNIADPELPWPESPGRCSHGGSSGSQTHTPTIALLSSKSTGTSEGWAYPTLDGT